jgi:dipeptidyl aminopeptidase/acylaminoacyl peptidase
MVAAAVGVSMPEPYGSWQSPVTAAMVAAGGVDLGHLALDGGTAYWHERRPEEGGRGVVVRETADGHEDVTPEDVDVRTLVHEYGGGDFAVDDGVVYYARYDDQRLYRLEPGGDPEPMTPEPEGTRGLRYADLTVDPAGDRIYAVREDHDAVVAADDRDDVDVDEPVTTLVAVPTDGEGAPETLARGHDFYAAPRPSPDGDRLAWLTWDHPRMPWDGTTLHVADVAADGSLTDEVTPMGGRAESVFDPTWGPEGTLYAVSDRTGWWNPYRVAGEPEPLVEREAEYGVPAWLFGLSTLTVLDDGRVAAVVTEDGRQHLELLDDDDREVVDLPYDTLSPARLRTDGAALVLQAADATTPTGVVRRTHDGDTETLRASASVDVDEAYLSTPQHLVYDTRDGAEAHAYVYPPTNPDVEAPDDEKPPLVVMAHGGPTSATHPALDLTVQFFTSRGFAVADVDYRGSTGYGRAYREALYGEWGTVDVKDTIDAALHLANDRRVDPDRMAVRGGSAGGFVVLAALAFHDAFTAGASYYGVADLARLAELTHKFESRYLDQLVGPYPEAEGTYRERSPVHHAEAIDVPLLLLQGAEDPVVPLSQAEAMADAVSAPHDLLVFEDEQHGFRAADARRRAHEAELAFYGEVFGFDPADDGLAAPDLA